eukprot:INCI14663.1.p1 GENE.INCI14663.1~~INCI14663.1.p1  ORF type:complete len:479 (-),score=124.00 INCI14663.1:1083-2519(-)
MQSLQFQQQARQQLIQSREVMMKMFWHSQTLEIQKIDSEEHTFRVHPLPLARIKKIMKTDDAVKMISAETPIVFAKACELFIIDLTKRAWHSAEDNKRRTLQKSDVAAARTTADEYDFLVDLLPRPDPAVSGTGEDAAADASASAAGLGMGGLTAEQLQLLLQQQQALSDQPDAQASAGTPASSSNSSAGGGRASTADSSNTSASASTSTSSGGASSGASGARAGGIPDLSQFGFPGFALDASGQLVSSAGNTSTAASAQSATPDLSSMDPALLQMYEQTLLQQQQQLFGLRAADTSAGQVGTDAASMQAMQQLLLQQQLLSQANSLQRQVLARASEGHRQPAPQQPRPSGPTKRRSPDQAALDKQFYLQQQLLQMQDALTNALRQQVGPGGSSNRSAQQQLADAQALSLLNLPGGAFGAASQMALRGAAARAGAARGVTGAANAASTQNRNTAQTSSGGPPAAKRSKSDGKRSIVNV